jgi:ATP-dependent Clp protease ATP-binding subunit ClpA
MNSHPATVHDLNDLEAHLLSRIKGQSHVIPRVCSVLERGQLGLEPAGKPLGSFLFLGPTGVGKTELTLEFTRYLFGENRVFRFDLDAARITIADHNAYDLSGFYIVCTSNIGAQQLLRPTRLPFTTLERAVISQLHRFFRPELIGRFDEKIVFRPLSSEVQREIGRAAIDLEIERFSEHGFNLTVSEAAFEFLVRRGIHKALGARPMKKTVQKFIGDAVRDALKAGVPSSGVLAVSPLNDRLMIQ